MIQKPINAILEKCSQSLLEIDHVTKIGDDNKFKMAAGAILDLVYRLQFACY